MVRADPELSTLLRVQRWHIEGPEDSIYRVLSADATLQQGLNPTFVIFDEVHVQPNRDLWDAMVLGMVRPGAMIVGITTAGFDKTTLAWDLYERGSRGDFYFWWREPADPDCDWQDPVSWAQANPALGDFLPLDVLRADAKTTPESAYRRFHLNQWTTTHTAWLPHGVWRSIERPDRAIDPKEPVVLFLDGSWSNDSTGLAGCTVNDPQLFTVGLWTPDPELGHIDVAAVETGWREFVASHNVVESNFDPRFATDLFSRIETEGYPINQWQTASLDRMVPACAAFYRATVAGLVHHDGDPRMAAHIANAVLKSDYLGDRIKKESKTSTRKIDLAVCAVGAFDRALWWATHPRTKTGGWAFVG